MFQINNLYSNTNITRTIRFSAPIYDALMQAAEEEGVTVNLLRSNAVIMPYPTGAKTAGRRNNFEVILRKACGYYADGN